jgi:hypothetical protein
MAGTNGGSDYPHLAAEIRVPGLLWWAYAGCLLLVGAVGATSYWMDAVRYGRDAPFATFAINEATSVVIIFALTWPLVAWTLWLARRQSVWVVPAIGHLCGVVVFDILHILGMNGLRLVIFPLIGQTYRMPPFLDCVAYELRKDMLVYGGMAAGILVLRRLFQRSRRAPDRAASPASGNSPRIEIRDGAQRTWIVPEEILWVEAAGNYVELHTAERSLLWRRTLSAVEAELAPSRFQRIHRSRLVNLRHVKAAANNDNGDFAITLSNGVVVSGARRWRAAFDQAAR